jgi:hypothetical protein
MNANRNNKKATGNPPPVSDVSGDIPRDLPDEVRNTMLFVAVERIDEALGVALCSKENADDDLPLNAEV